MKQKFMLLNGINFKVLNDTKSGKMWLEHIEEPCKGYNSIWDAYDRPSTTKESIWNEWKTWFLDTFKNGEMVVSSKNCNFFSISFRGYTENRLYKGYITATRNEVIYIER